MIMTEIIKTGASLGRSIPSVSRLSRDFYYVLDSCVDSCRLIDVFLMFIAVFGGYFQLYLSNKINFIFVLFATLKS